MEALLPQAKVDIFAEYTRSVIDVVNSRPRNAVIIDFGGGKQCPFAQLLNGERDTTIVALDISETELRYNKDVKSKLVADFRHGLPFGPRTVDIITSRSVLEHVENVKDFVMHSSGALKQGGYWVHLFPSKFAPFALINQMLPKAVSRSLVHFFHPGSKGICGFPASYDACYSSAMRKLLLKNGFELVDLKLSFYQSQYYDFCFPLFLLSAGYEMLVSLLGLRNLAAYVLVVARRT